MIKERMWDVQKERKEEDDENVKMEEENNIREGLGENGDKERRRNWWRRFRNMEKGCQEK